MANSQMILLKKLAVACVGLATFSAVAFLGLSTRFQNSSPDWALTFNPVNSHARIRSIAAELDNRADPSQLLKLRRAAEETIRIASIDAKAYSLLGEVYRLYGDDTTAAALFETALALSKTDFLALNRSLLWAVESSNHDETVSKMDVLLRRWPDQFDTVSPILLSLLSSPGGYQIALSKLREMPPWRDRFLNFLNRNAETLTFAYKLQLDLNAQQTGRRTQEIGRTISALMRAGRRELAFRLFLLTQSEEDRSNNGYVFNGSFALQPSGRRFDWTLQKTPGVALVRQKEPGDDSYALAVRFLDKPVKLIGVTQVVHLPPGQYRLSAHVSTNRLKMPKGLYFNLTCLNGTGEIARLNVPDRPLRDEMIETQVNQASGDCRFLKLGMGTGLVAESFRYRYSGTLLIHDIALTGMAP
ncbi:hypothetical protein [Hoeflea sp. TYP-13]|uniref:hypothetical protein n=1 Tax=Hoeflea sp. TYP-13 TaxID=3230023 RepID=UPI0034C613C9